MQKSVHSQISIKIYPKNKRKKEKQINEISVSYSSIISLIIRTLNCLNYCQINDKTFSSVEDIIWTLFCCWILLYWKFVWLYTVGAWIIIIELYYGCLTFVFILLFSIFCSKKFRFFWIETTWRHIFPWKINSSSSFA